MNAELKFTETVLADIFLGKITKWNDPAITRLNSGVTLPGSDIIAVHRSDGLYESPKDKAQAKVMLDFMNWALGDGQKFATSIPRSWEARSR